MTADTVRRVADQLGPEHTDAELLGRFVAERDGEAFAALVERHGPMVFGVCRRVLGDWHLAEDAFQATFVVLARRAPAVLPSRAVAGWLHGVAQRVAKSARRATLRRFRRERPVEAFPDPPAPSDPETELRAVLDAELQKLPAKYREVLVACDFEGRPRQPVAEGLGIPQGTLSSRLAAARKLLARRLAKRGIAPAVVASVTANGPPAVAGEVPRALLASTAQMGAATSGAVPEPVATLADGAIRAMTVRKYLPWCAALLLTTTTAAIGLAAALTRAPPAPPSSPVRAPVPQPETRPLPVGPNKLLLVGDRCLVLADPNGKTDKKVLARRDALLPAGVRLSPDGKTLALLISTNFPEGADVKPGELPPTMLHVRGLDEQEPGTDLGIECETFAWSSDGTEIVYSGPGQPKPGEDERPLVHGIVNVKTKVKVPLKLPPEYAIIDWSRDGKSFLAQRANDEDWSARLYLISRDGKESKALTDLKDEGEDGRISPDGKRVLCISRPNEVRVTPGDSTLWLHDLATGKKSKVSNLPPKGWLTGACWSPDGSRVAYTWEEKVEDAGGGARWVTWLVVCDPDGKNAVKVEHVKSEENLSFVTVVDWR